MFESDLDLLRAYAQEGSEAAFAEVVRRHVDLVFSVALRMVRSRQLAEEVAQSAFLDLARNIHRLRSDTVVSAWLHRVTHRTAVDAIRRETRRTTREQLSADMSALNSPTDDSEPDWNQIEPHLDGEIASLQETDRIAVLLRYFEGKTLAEVGRAIGSGEDAAQKRVSRALEKLRLGLQRRGVAVGSGALGALISTQAVHAAPVGLASSIAGAAASVAVAGGGIAAAAAKTAGTVTLKKIAIGLVAAGTLGVAAIQTQKVRRLERQLAAIAERGASIPSAGDGGARAAGLETDAGGAPQTPTGSPTTASPELLAERERLLSQRDAAERLTRLYKDLATSRETTGATNQFPTARHVTAAMGRLSRRSALMQETLKGIRLEELPPEEQKVMEAGSVAMLEEIAKLTAVQFHFRQIGSVPKDPIDEKTVFIYGALDLDEQQFRQVYTLLRDLERNAANIDQIHKDNPADGKESLNALNAEAEAKLNAILTPAQQKILQVIGPNLPWFTSSLKN